MKASFGILVASALIVALAGSLQGQQTVRGVVVDNHQTRTPIPQVAVLVLDSMGTRVVATVST